MLYKCTKFGSKGKAASSDVKLAQQGLFTLKQSFYRSGALLPLKRLDTSANGFRLLVALEREVVIKPSVI